VFKTLGQAGDLMGKRALVRVEFNVPLQDGVISDDTRLRAALPTIETLRKAGAIVVLLAHFDRPKGKVVASMSLEPVAGPLAALIGAPVAFAPDCVGPVAQAAISSLTPGDVILLENLRFHAGEEANAPDFAKALAALGDLYVNDAFSAAHRAHASTEGLAHLLPAYAGQAMRSELEALELALGKPQRPVLGILMNLVGRLDHLAIGGGMANTFLFAQGIEVGASFCEKDLADTAREIMAMAKTKGCELLLPIDVVVAQKMEAGAESRTCALDAIGPLDRILDAGPKTTERLIGVMQSAKTLIWNGPLGVFEIAPFDAATVAAAKAAAALAKSGKLIAVAGGGDTVSALAHAGVSHDFSFVSTAGGAFLEWMEGKTLPGIAALES
jgi:phosphoglycerate kinase